MEDRAGAVDELVAGFCLEGEGGRVLCEVEVGAQVDLVPMSYQEEQQKPERQPADHGRTEAGTTKAHEVPAGAAGCEHHEGGAAPSAQQAVHQPGAGEQRDPEPVDAGQARSGTGREKKHERGDGQVEQVPDVAGVGPHAAIRSTIGAAEAADVGEHVEVGGKADQPEKNRAACQPPPDVVGWRPWRRRATSSRRSAAEQNAQAQADGAKAVQNLDVDQIGIVEIAAQRLALREAQV